jgi:hypothetical protein
MDGPKASPAGAAGSQDVVEQRLGPDAGAVDRQTGDLAVTLALYVDDPQSGRTGHRPGGIVMNNHAAGPLSCGRVHSAKHDAANTLAGR